MNCFTFLLCGRAYNDEINVDRVKTCFLISLMNNVSLQYECFDNYGALSYYC